MNIIKFMAQLQEREILFWIDEGRLRCKGPNDAFSPELNQQIKNRKDEIYQYLEKAKTALERQEQPIPVVSREQNLPLSFAQQRLWFLEQYEGENSLYNMPFSLKINGDLSLSALEKALLEIVGRHEALRTVCVDLNGIPCQKIQNADSISFPVEDLRDLDEAVQQEKIQTLKKADFQRPFSLADDLMLRARLIRLQDEEYLLLMVFHHIAFDGWSWGVFQKELVTLYQAFRDEKASPLPELTVQYADYAVWQKEYLEQGPLKDQLDYWKNRLEAAPKVHQLPLDHSRPAKQTFNGAIHRATIAPDLLERLNQLSQQNEATLFMTLQAAFSLLLSRYSQADDIMLGTPVANRNHSDLEPLIGFFLNTLILRTDLSGDPTFIDLLRQVRSNLLEDSKNQDVTFAQIVEELKPERSLGYSPFFQIMIILQNNAQAEQSIKGIRFSQFEREDTGAKFDLTLDLYEEEGGLSCMWEYNTDLFEQESIERMAANFETLICGILENPTERLSRQPLLNDAKEKELLLSWNQTDLDYPAQETIHKLFEKQAEKSPDKVAISFEGECLTFKELNEKSNQLAHYLIAEGVVTGSLVGLCLDRSVEMVIGLLAILKAGAAYVPLDPIYPADRLHSMLEDAHVTLLLTQKKLIDLFQKDVTKTVTWEKAEEQLPTKRTTAPITGVNAKDLAYVIYTSGTTGKPKGVQITHQNLNNFLYSMKEKPGFSEQDTLLSVTTICFDIFGLELFLPLLFGGTHYLVSSESAMDGNELSRHLAKSDATIMQATPSTWSMLLESGWKAESNFKVLCGGEPLPQKLAKALTEQKAIELWNMYGPTETTVWSTIEKITDADKKITVGKPVGNTQIHILDSHNNPVPIGAIGEILIGGDGVAVGYRNRPELTKEKFIDNPFSENSGKLYKTGDLGRFLADGRIECLGRIDHQVKIRGFRIELGDIESALLKEESVAEAVVVVREDQSGDKRLVGYYVAKTEENSSLTETLYQNCRTTLPEYMVPSALVSLKTMPLTQNGKVDRKALPEPENFIVDSTEYVAPKTELEATLAEAWQEILGLDKVGRNDNFFRIGGHSILAVRLINHIRKTAGLEIALKALFENPTIAQLAQQAKVGEKEETPMPELVIDLENRHEPFPLSDVQQAYFVGRSGSFDLGNVGTHIYTESPVEELDSQRFEAVLNQMIQRHEMLRMVITEDGQQKILKEVPHYKVPILDLSELSEEEGEKAFMQWREELSHQLFTGLQWPLFDIRLTRFKDQSWKVHYSMDALVMDGSSHNIFSGEFQYLYVNEGAGLPELELSFRDYMVAEKGIAGTDRYDKAKEYWINRAYEIPAAPELPMAPAGSQVENPHFERRYLTLNKEQWGTLNKKAQNIGVTPTVLLLGAFGEILKRWSKNPHFTLNLTLFNRMPLHEQVDAIIGDFTSLTMLEMDHRDSLSFSDQLKRIQGQLWSDLEHSHFSGIEVQREISRAVGETVTMPVVFTSLLGVEEHASEGLLGGNQRENLTELQEPFTISQTSQVWLDHQVTERDGTVALNWDSVEGLFPEKMLDEMFAAYETLLMDLIAEESAWAESKLANLPKRQKTIRDLANTTEGDETDLLMHQLFQNSVKNNPDAIAIESDRKVLTYRELESLGNQIALDLRANGAKTNELVAIVMEKGWEQVAAALGIQMSGAAYLPVDATQPADRIAKILEIGEVKSIISISDILSRLNLTEKYHCLAVDQLNEKLEVSPLESIQKQSDIAYVIFTSGSTGEPKGVVIDHRGAVNTILDVNERFNVTAKDKAIGLSALSFDLSVYDIYGLLAVGGTIVIPEEGERKDPEAWLHYLKQYGVTLWNTVPALMQMMVEFAEERDEQLNLRLILMSGDWIPVDLPDRIKALCDNPTVISLGGATEASIWSILYPIEAVGSDWKSIPYGKAMKNQTFHVLKDDLSEAPEWVPGELYIGGIGLAKEYWRDEKKTNASFITHPVTKERLYKTGDLGCYLPDGNIEFQGRNDFQVKIQGYRIELGEIESTLLRNEEVRDAVVCAVDAGKNAKQLAAWVVLKEEKNSEEQADSVGELATAGNSIVDKHERALFKMEKHGIRSIDSAINSIALKRSDEPLKITSRNHKDSAFEATTISQESFNTLFDAVVAKQFEEQLLPKYYYPSAGSLYPVQLYLAVQPGRVEGVAGGTWYYNPIEHRLDQISEQVDSVFVSEEEKNAAFALFMVADQNAIEPLYGKYSDDFSILEGGYMAQLLENTVASTIALKESSNFAKADIETPFQLHSNHLLIQSWFGGGCENKVEKTAPTLLLSYEERKSYRSWIEQSIASEALERVYRQIDGVKSYLFTKSGSVEGLDTGVYEIDSAAGTLSKINAIEDIESVFSGSEPMYHNAGFAIFTIGSKESGNGERCRNRELYLSGYVGQAMMNQSTKDEIGLCAIGIVNPESAKEALTLNDGEMVLHAFLGGKVEAESIQQLEIAETVAHIADPKEALQQYLEEKLPHYMVPKAFLFLDKIPLTPNGKVNRKALPAVDFDAIQAKEHVEPTTEGEILLAGIWRELLELESIGTNDNFFELGGHSILAVRLVNRVRQETGKDIELRTLFEKPTIGDLAKHIFSEETKSNAVELPTLIVDETNRYEPFPLSDVQQAYWIGRSGSFDLGDVGTHSYSENPIPELDPNRFTEVLNQMIQRHEMMRMVITEDGQQQILKEVPYYDVKILDFQEMGEEQATDQFYQWREELSHQLFTGLEWPLFDIRLTRFRDNSWKIHYSMDSLIMDAASQIILLQEFAQLYTEPKTVLPELNLSFRDYMVTERAMTEMEIFKRAGKYWTDRAETLPAAPELPVAKSASEIEDPSFERRAVTLNREMWNNLQKKAQEVGVTPTVFLIGVFGETLNRWSKSPKFTLNLTLFNRLPFHDQVDQVIGDFTSLTLLEVNAQDSGSFADYLKSIQQQLWDDLEHKYFTGIEVQRELSRMTGETVTMPVVVTSMLGIGDDMGTAEESETNEQAMDSVPELQKRYMISQTSQVWLDHQISENNGELTLVWDFVAELFPAKMMDDMFAAYERLLRCLGSDENRWQQQLSRPLPERQNEIRTEANQTQGSESNLLMHELFQRQAEITPDSIAILSDRKTMTYQALDRLGNRLAYLLREAGAVPNQLVAIVMEKGWEQVVAALGIQIAGAAYLPVDATQPEERIRRILELGEVKQVVSISSVLDRLNLADQYQCLAIDQIEKEAGYAPKLETVQTRNDIAYVIFTSGSTGEPKGVVIDHRGAVNTILDVNERFGVTEKDKAIALSALSFDLSVYDIYGLLAVGGAIVIPEEGERKDPESWLRYLKQNGVTLWNTVPALMQMMVEFAEERNERLDLRLVLMSGDWIPVDLPDRIKQLCENVDVISLGGATEASIWSILYPIETVPADWKSIPYGKAMKNQTFHVLKDDYSAAPEWVAGELYIGGIGVAKEYWRDPIKTANSFITHPETGERLYKTGDLGRYLPDGNIEFLGRNDFQVKIQGYRIELGEIESTLTQHEMIRDAVVSAVDAGKNAKQLVAWVVPKETETEEDNDNVGGLSEAGNTIVDKQERSLFKMEQHGIRELPFDVISQPLPSITTETLRITSRNHVNDSVSGGTVSMVSLSRLFHCLAYKRFEEQPLPKYYYPSAGSLYPVQAYLSVQPGRVEGLEGGNYYYHPEKHSLERITSVTHESDAPFQLYLVGDLNAIEPLYGKHAEPFCVLEAGYMAQLLENTAPGTLVLNAETNPDGNISKEAFRLHDKQILLRSWSGCKIATESIPNGPVIEQSYVERKSYRSFIDQQITDTEMKRLLKACDIKPALGANQPEELKIYLFVKEGAVAGMEAGVYLLDQSNNSLTPVNHETDTIAVFNGSEGIYKTAGFAIFMVAPKADEHRNLYLSGYMGQAMMNGSTSDTIGLCAIGIVNDRAATERLTLPEGEIVLHSFLGGKVDPETIHRLESFDPAQQTVNPQEEIHRYLEEKLPHYMIPKAFLFLEKIPLTANGKVDRKALPMADLEKQEQKEYVAPETPNELLLADIWKELLNVEQVGTTDNFFELGGHSILAVRMVNRIRKETDIDIALKTLFEKPTITELALFLAQNEQQNADANQLPDLIVDRENRYEPFPMSDVQQAYWIGRSDAFDLGNIGTHVYSEFPLEEVNPTLFEQVLNQMIQRHEMLRMVITEDGQQKILETVPEYKLPILDLQGATEEEETEEFFKWRGELSHQLFSGMEWPLFDIRLTRFRDNTWKIHYSMDALVMDGSSHDLFFQDFLAMYGAPSLQLPEFQLSFRDYIMTEKAMTEMEIYKRSKDYWVNRAHDIPSAPELPLAKPASEIEDPRFERRSIAVSKERWTKLQNKIQEVGVTPTVFLINMFGEALKQWSKTPHFTLNLTLFNRLPFHEQVDRIIGDFTSLTLLEMDYRQNGTFSDALKSVQSQLWDDLEHKHFSGIELQRELSRLTGETVTMPVVVTSMLGIREDMGGQELALKPNLRPNLLEYQQLYTISQTPQVWLDHQISQIDGQLFLVWDSVKGLFPEKMLDEMLAAYEALLNRLIDQDSTWEEPTRLPLPERQLTIRQEANQTEGANSDLLMHELFRDQAKRSPDAAAVLSDRKSLTYRELNLLANRIGQQLRAVGAKTNELVAIVMEKGWEQVAAALGIQIAGAAYLPIDATLPKERIQKILKLGKVKSILSITEVLDRLALPSTFNCLAVDELEKERDEVEPPVSVQTIDDIAYVIFTSGSTGEPKGVVIDHRGAVNTILDINERFGVTEKDRAMGLSALSFDLSVYDIYGMLAAGGAIVLPKEDERRDPVAWLKYLREHKVTLWNTVPALMQMLVEVSEDRKETLELKSVLMSGDWIPVDLPNRIKALCDNVTVTSLGGATEASIWSILYPIANVDSAWKSIPYGKPMVNQTFHVLKDDLSNAPEWVPGELYIGGIGLAKCYWGDEEKTNASFIIHPKTGERLYKTGDLGRYLPDGNIEFLGRNDFQVKIQGYRIELGEIESTLTQHNLIRDAVVCAVDADRNAKQLAAWIVPNKEAKEESDNVGELSTAGNTITNKQERSLFKMQQRNIRKLAEQTETIALPQPTEGKLLIESRDHNTLQMVDRKISLESFAQLFTSMLQKRFEEMPLPKYYYPSAGSLYPVQIYLAVRPDRVEGISGGAWYYNPSEHRLDRLALDATALFDDEANNPSAFSMFLIADPDAIEPLYGKFSEDFSLLEAGYMAQLLENSAPMDICLKPGKRCGLKHIKELFQLKPNHTLIHSWLGGSCDTEATKADSDSKLSIFAPLSDTEQELAVQLPLIAKAGTIEQSYEERKSYRSFQSDMITLTEFSCLLRSTLITPALSNAMDENLKLYLFVKENRVEQLKGGIYTLHPKEGLLLPVESTGNPEAVFNGSEGIYQSAAFALFIVGENSETTDKAVRDQNVYLSGYIGQAMMNISTKDEIGLCAIGIVNDRSARAMLDFNDKEEVLHSFLGGKVSAESIQRIEAVEVPTTMNPHELVQNYLEEKLPHYMVPRIFHFVESIPKTGNGKVDRNGLISMQSQTIEFEEEIVPPQTETEERIAKIWREVLQRDRIGANQNFFDLGGNSLLILRLSKGLASEFGQEIAIAKLFQFTTIQKMAKYFELDQDEAQTKKLDQVQKWAAGRKSKRSGRRR